MAFSSRQLARFSIIYRQTLIRPCVCSFSTSIDSFYASSSIRSQRRRRRLVLLQQRQETRENATNNVLSSEYKDTRTIKDILFPSPDYGDDANQHGNRFPKTLAGWKEGLRQGWIAYRSTWDGFFTSKGFIVEHKEPNELNEDSVQNKTEQIKENVKHNAQFLAQESETIRNKVTDATGISTKEDLRRVAADMMRLAADSVNQFMAGYRKGRDDEVEKMLTQYFQELETAANKPRRRKIKRRVRKHI